jgi:DNA polymerase-1
VFGGVHFSDYPDPDNISVMDMGCLPMIHDMQRYGIRLDVPYLNSLTIDIKRQQSEILDELSIHLGNYQDFNGKSRVPFSVGSPDHVSRLLFEHLKVQGDDTVPMTTKGKRFTTSDDVLEIFRPRSPVIGLILEWREFEKARSTYTEPLVTLVDSASKLHTSFNVTVAATGRLSSSNPNLQNIPIRSTLLVNVGGNLVKLGVAIRNAFIASTGCVFVSVDRGQDEMRWAAHGSQDSNMMQVFHNRQDIHWKTTCAIFNHDYDSVMKMKGTAEFDRMKREERAPCKNLGFGVLYGLTAKGLQRNILVESAGDINWTEEQCQKFILQFFDVYPGLRAFMDLQYTRARRHAMVWDAFGRSRLVPEGRSALRKIANEGMRKAGNHFEQSSSQGGVKLAMAEINVEMRERTKTHQCLPALQIHDQIVGDVDKRIAKEFGESMKIKMEGSVELYVPSESSLEFAERWGELA